MKIGLMIAVEQELAAFLESGEDRTEETVAGKTVYRTRMEGHEIFAVRSGCGEIDAASATALLIVRYGLATIMALVFWFLLPFGMEVRKTLVLLSFAPIPSSVPGFTAEMDSDVGLSCTINSLSIICSIFLMVALLVLV